MFSSYTQIKVIPLTTISKLEYVKKNKWKEQEPTYYTKGEDVIYIWFL